MIAVITYNTTHKKTQDLLLKLKLETDYKVCVIATPWINRKNFIPLFQHRPSYTSNISLSQICKILNFKLITISKDELEDFFNTSVFDSTLIAGAGILPEKVVKNKKIINSHPGYLPYVKGLDALKWAIYNEQKIGVTTHFISAETDEGLLIEKKEVPIFYEDSFHSLSLRVYNTEINMLVNSIEKAQKIENFEDLSNNIYTPKKRMPHHKEIMMLNKFEKLRLKSPSIYNIKNYNKLF